MTSGVISYPVPAYANVPINAQFYKPSRLVISGITLGLTTLVTTTTDNNYVIGQTCRLIIPPTSGCRQLNEVQGNVLSIPNPNQVVLSINSVGSDAFLSSMAKDQPQILPIGDVNNGQINADGPLQTLTYIPGSFINISPQ